MNTTDVLDVAPTIFNESVGASAEPSVSPETPGGRYSIPEMVMIAIVAGCLSMITVVGNSMVMISFKIDKQLQTISNYFLFSLAVADFAIGLISMPLFTVSTILGYWPLGPHICDTWLALDYLASNASVLNLLIISFDRYFSVTRPLTYRAKRTTNRAAVMIGCAWGISLLLWPPWIYSWPYIEGERTVPDNECYIQFIETNHYITFGTAIAAFYVPVTVMCILYWRIWRETEKRQKDLPNLQAGKKESSKRSNSRYDEAVDLEDWKRPRSESSTAQDEMGDSGKRARPFSWAWLRAWCVAWWQSGRERDDATEPDYEDTPSDMGYATPVSVETPLQSSVSRCTSLNVIRDPYAAGGGGTQAQQTPTRQPHHLHHHQYDSRSLPASSRLAVRSVSSDSVYTILIRLPPESSSCDGNGSSDQPSIKMIADDAPSSSLVTPIRGAAGSAAQRLVGRVDSTTSMGMEYSLHPAGGYPVSPAINRRPSQMPDIRIPLNAKIIPKQLAGGPKALVANAGPKMQQHQQKKEKENSGEEG